MPIQEKPIGVFDSGVGGLTVLRALVKALPGESFVYFGDTARVPYGTKSPAVVRQFSLQNSLFLLKYDVKLIIVACNSASAMALDFLRKRLLVPAIGVIEPGVKAVLKESPISHIGIIGTRATIASGAYQKALKAAGYSGKIIVAYCPLFVPLIEEGMIWGKIPLEVAEYYLNPMKAEGIGALLLGCTHYPLLESVISQVMGKDVAIVDSARTTADEVKAELQRRNWLNLASKGAVELFASDISPEIERQSRAFFGGDLPPVKKVEFEVADFWV